MSLSIQTNVDSILAQHNLQVNSEFQSRTIQRLTSGYRINNSSDDAAGLAVANNYRNADAELTQGVRNANDGIGALQIVDGGLGNISAMLDRLKTLATQSATDTFVGDRGTLNTEYQTLLSEISRQANNIGLGTGSVGARYAKDVNVYVGGASGVQQNAQVTTRLANQRVDSFGLGISATNILGGLGVELDTTQAVGRTYLGAAGAKQILTFHTATNAAGLQVNLVGNSSGVTYDNVLNQINTQLAGTGISAALGTDGAIQFFGGNTAFSIDVGVVTGGGNGILAGTAAVSNAAQNQNMYMVAGSGSTMGSLLTTSTNVALTALVNGVTVNVSFTGGDSVQTQIDKINSALNPYGVSFVRDAAGAHGWFMGSTAFSVSGGYNLAQGAGVQSAAAQAASNTGNSNTAIVAIQNAVTALGTVQGKIGAGQNLLQYAVNLANSQIANNSAAESAIRDADVAAEASNLTKSQVLQQASLAALAQANAEPQSILSLLKNL